MIKYMNNENGFDLIIALVFDISPQLGGLGPKYHIYIPQHGGINKY